MNRLELAAELKKRARDAGADLAGIAAAAPSPDAPAYDAWLGAGMHGEMAYMSRNAESRRDIRAWMTDAKSVLMCGFSYGEPGTRPSSKEGRGRLARYAVRKDYHEILRGRMNGVRDWLTAAVPEARGLAFCDMSPILERSYAAAAGLGWQGKNTMLLGADIGSYFLIAGLAVNVDLPADSPGPDRCGTCTKCLEACPTGAFPRERVLDASKCVAYFTIESKGAIPASFREGIGDWIYGCDVCQEVCPWNRFEKPSRALPPPAAPTELPLEELAGPGSAGVRARLKGLPVARAVRKRLTRNALLAMGNSRLERYRPVLENYAAGADPVLAEQARWSLDAIRASHDSAPAQLSPAP
ncbi:MAG: tRNA epoxyqueuosine(34) reductase QueG [Elusimicrobia bacterium]|nr:tRNA epoxyqueuosine(34) reductase QueG [Elusimicrobiota bacterium]